jgi:tellurite resistance protein TerC
MTPLFLALVLIEIADVIFAVDSVPAIFAITTDPFIVYTSNIFAILGLRALYFALAAMVHRFHYLKYALSVVLIFIGSKIFVADLIGLDKFPPALSLAITFGILTAGIVWSLWKTRGPGQPAEAMERRSSPAQSSLEPR